MHTLEQEFDLDHEPAEGIQFLLAVIQARLGSRTQILGRRAARDSHKGFRSKRRQHPVFPKAGEDGSILYSAVVGT